MILWHFGNKHSHSFNIWKACTYHYLVVLLIYQINNLNHSNTLDITINKLINISSIMKEGGLRPFLRN